MKKIFVIAGLITLLAVLVRPVYAASGIFDMASGEHFMRLDTRDASNQSVESNYSFQTTPFLKVYTMLTPFGVCNWQRSPVDNAVKICSKRIFKVPLDAVTYICSQRRILSRFSEKIASKEYTHKIGIYLLILNLILILEFVLQSKKEPRFRVPVLIE